MAPKEQTSSQSKAAICNVWEYIQFLLLYGPNFTLWTSCRAPAGGSWGREELAHGLCLFISKESLRARRWQGLMAVQGAWKPIARHLILYWPCFTGRLTNTVWAPWGKNCVRIVRHCTMTHRHSLIKVLSKWMSKWNSLLPVESFQTRHVSRLQLCTELEILI